jgi:hypothetical protein
MKPAFTILAMAILLLSLSGCATRPGGNVRYDAAVSVKRLGSVGNTCKLQAFVLNNKPDDILAVNTQVILLGADGQAKAQFKIITDAYMAPGKTVGFSVTPSAPVLCADIAAIKVLYLTLSAVGGNYLIDQSKIAKFLE